MNNVFNPSAQSTHFFFWQKWLFYSSILFVIVGFGLAFLSKTFLFNPYNKMLAEIFWNTSQLPENVVYFKNSYLVPWEGHLYAAIV